MKILNTLLTILTIMVFIALAVLCYYNWQQAKNIKVLESSLSDCGQQRQAAELSIERQNAAIDAVRIDTVYVDKLIKEASQKYVEIREVVIQSLEKDSSCENKIGNIDVALRRFHGVELRPQGGN